MPALGAVSQYMRDISRYPLLTPQEERRLMERVIRGRKTKSEKARQKAFVARQKLINSNQRLVFHIVKQYIKPCSENFLDAINEGNFGLMHAIDDMFEYGRGAEKLSTYAATWIKQKIRRYLQENMHMIHVPAYILNAPKRYHEAVVTIKKRANGVGPDKKEIARETGLSEKRVQCIELGMELAMHQPFSVDQVVKEGNSSLSYPLDNGSDVQSVEAEVDNKKIPEIVVKCLEPREAFVILVRFGMPCPEEILVKLKLAEKNGYLPSPGSHTLKEISKVLGVSRERVRQIEKRAKSKLAGALKSYDPTSA